MLVVLLLMMVVVVVLVAHKATGAATCSLNSADLLLPAPSPSPSSSHELCSAVFG